MLNSGTDPESYIPKYIAYEGKERKTRHLGSGARLAVGVEALLRCIALSLSLSF